MIADAFGAFHLRADVSRWPILTAVAAFFLITAAQIAGWYWKRCHAARTALLERRLHTETGQLAVALRCMAGGAEATSNPPPPKSDASTSASVNAPSEPDGSRSARRFRALLQPYARISGYSADEDVRRSAPVIARFALEPTWAYQQLDAMGVAAATSIARRWQLHDARAVGAATALLMGVVPIVAAVDILASLRAPANALAAFLACAAALVLILAALFYRTAKLMADPAFIQDERQYYPRVERLLELHRFDLYRALGLRMPRSAHEERQMAVGGWRTGQDASYDLPSASAADGDRVQDISDLLRGPELVAYDGYVSWEVAADHVQLTFARTPASGATGSARIQVEGKGSESHAAFDISADSQEVILAKVQESVLAPVDGRAARLTFSLSRPPVADPSRSPGGGQPHSEPVIWFEIRQMGRFIQLLRIPLAAGQTLDA